MQRHRAVNEALEITQALLDISDQAEAAQQRARTAQAQLHQALTTDRELTAQFQRLHSRLAQTTAGFAPTCGTRSSEATRVAQQPADQELARQQGVERPADTVRNAFVLLMLPRPHTIPSQHQQDILPPQTPRHVHNQLGQFIQRSRE